MTSSWRSDASLFLIFPRPLDHRYYRRSARGGWSCGPPTGMTSGSKPHSTHRTTVTAGFGSPFQRNRYVFPFLTFMTSAGRKQATHVPRGRRTLG